MVANLPYDENMPRVVVIGGGFGGLQLINHLKRSGFQIVLLDKYNHHTFQPLLYQVATAGLEAGSIAYPLRKMLRRVENDYFRVAEVEKVTPNENCMKTSVGTIKYDYLVIATGSRTNYFGMKDVEEHSLPLKAVREAIDMRHMILQNFEKVLLLEDPLERRRLMTIVIGGAGPTGVELAGALSELRSRVLPKDYPEIDFSQMRIIVVDPLPKVLAAMSEKASKKAKKYLEDFDVEVVLDKGVKSYDGKTLALSDGSTIETATLIWAAGVAANAPGGLPDESMERGRIIVDEYNRIKGLPNAFAIGDVAKQVDEGYEKGLPMLAPVAIQQGKHLARNLKRLAKNEAMKPFKYRNKGTMATIGRMRAVVDLPNGWTFGGFFAWMTWLFVHLLYLIGFRNKMAVFFEWVYNYVTFDRRVRLIVRPFTVKEQKQAEQKPPLPVEADDTIKATAPADAEKVREEKKVGG